MTGTPNRGLFWTERRRDASRPLVIGHRGAPEYALENTRKSFEKAIACGADAVETDLRLTSDGKVVCLHDGDLLRVAGAGDSISTLTLSAARQLFPALLTFDEFLEFTGSLAIIVDVKLAADRELDAYVGVCRAHGALDRALFTAYSPGVARAIRVLSTHVAIGTFFPEGAGALQTARDVEASWIRVLPNDYQSGVIAGVRQAGLQSIAVAAPLSSFKTASDATALATISELGIDGVITDDPEFAVRYFGAF